MNLLGVFAIVGLYAWLTNRFLPKDKSAEPFYYSKKWGMYFMLFAPLTALNSSHLITKGDFGFFFAQLVILTPVQFAIGYIAGWVRGRFFSGNNQKTLQELSSSALAPKRVFTPVPDEEGAYARAADELETNQVDKATWARAFADADGDADKTKARYISLRVKKLTGEVQAQGAPITAIQLQTGDAGQGVASDSGGRLETG